MTEPVKLGYRIFRFRGAGVAPKFPVVLLRGLGRSSGFWLEFTEKLSEHHEVICLDLLGTGLSRSNLGRGRIAAFADDVIFTLNQLGHSKVNLVGISLGGMVALEVAARSDLVSRLAVLASSSKGGQGGRIKPAALIKLLWSLRKGTFKCRARTLSCFAGNARKATRVARGLGQSLAAGRISNSSGSEATFSRSFLRWPSCVEAH